ncbi:hypothetical protein ABPG77_001191 [Micractinium sp. CCAP 211/92]
MVNRLRGCGLRRHRCSLPGSAAGICAEHSTACFVPLLLSWYCSQRSSGCLLAAVVHPQSQLTILSLPPSPPLPSLPVRAAAAVVEGSDVDDALHTRYLA